MPRPAPKYAQVLSLKRLAVVEGHGPAIGGAVRGRSELAGGPAIFRVGTKHGSR
jgi:hypothetical protein